MEDNLEQAFKPVTVGKKSGSGLLRKQSLMTKSIEEKKQVLYNRQAGEYATWFIFLISFKFKFDIVFVF